MEEKKFLIFDSWCKKLSGKIKEGSRSVRTGVYAREKEWLYGKKKSGRGRVVMKKGRSHRVENVFPRGASRVGKVFTLFFFSFSFSSYFILFFFIFFPLTHSPACKLSLSMWDFSRGLLIELRVVQLLWHTRISLFRKQDKYHCLPSPANSSSFGIYRFFFSLEKKNFTISLPWRINCYYSIQSWYLYINDKNKIKTRLL